MSRNGIANIIWYTPEKGDDNIFIGCHQQNIIQFEDDILTGCTEKVLNWTPLVKTVFLDPELSTS